MNVVLLNPRLRTWSPNIWVPLDAAYIAAVLEQEGHNVEIIDLNIERMRNGDLQRRVKKADVVGVIEDHCMTVEYQEVLRITNILKKANMYRKVVLGGPLATALAKELLQVSQADFIVVGEAERTMVNLVSAINRGDSFSDIKGIAYKDSNQVVVTEPVEPIADLDTIPFPARHLLDMNRYLKNHFESFGFKIREFGKIKSTNIITSRGCPYSCTFCFLNIMWGYKWRQRSPENIIDEMELLYKNYGVNGFFFNDDTFILNRKRIFKLCDLLKQRGLDVVWYCNGRVNLMTKQLLEAMYSAGCRGIAYGIESGNQQVLDSMKKNITLDQVREVVKWTKEAGINSCGYFMIGMLGETRANIRETIDFAGELNLDFYGFSIVAPFPGTELYSAAVERGLIQEDMTSLKDRVFCVNANLTQDCSDGDLVTYANELFKEFTLKRFGKYYIANPTFLRQMAKVVLSLQSKNEAKELGRKTWGIIRSYWRKA